MQAITKVIKRGNLNAVLRLFDMDELDGFPSADADDNSSNTVSASEPVVTSECTEAPAASSVSSKENEPAPNKDWTLDELSKLAKGVSRYVGGTRE